MPVTSGTITAPASLRSEGDRLPIGISDRDQIGISDHLRRNQQSDKCCPSVSFAVTIAAAMTPLETYLRELRDIRSSGAAVEETASYSALANLLTEVGKQLKPKVRCITGLQDLGAGFPDGGLFTEEQFDKKHTLKPLPGQLPSRGVIEVKPVKNDAWITAEGEQVSRYWGKYRQVLVTNYRDFVLAGC